jgi:hypothetical protein
MKRHQLKPILDAIAGAHHLSLDQAGLELLGLRQVRARIDDALCDAEGDWALYLGRLFDLVESLERDSGPLESAPFSIFREDGNSKLPFLAFSALAGRDFCPGSGPCLEWCYSFRAWRYPAAFCRQAQNSLLLCTERGRELILRELDRILARRKFRAMESVDFRLYVDGDFRDANEVHFWIEALRERPQLAAYGYSKSFHELLGYGVALEAQGLAWPSNYLVNLSDGHRHAPATMAAMERLPITRGRFVAVTMGRKVKSSEHGDREHQAELRARYGRQAFTCPGKCGECTPKGHACGSERFRGVDVIIAVH